MKKNLFVFALAMILGVATAHAADVRATGRATAGKLGDAVIRINVVIKATFGGKESSDEEITREISGTVIGEDGLTIATLSNIDPASIMKRSAGEGDESSKFQTTVKGIKLLMRDGKEVPATVVLRDSELDLAFLRPITKPATKFTALNLADSAKPELLDEVFVLQRFGKIANRRIGAQTLEIQGIVEKPRAFYIPNPNSEAAAGLLGLPVFNADGKVIGMFGLHVMGGAGRSMEDGNESMLVTIVPAADIAESAKQAPEKAPASEKPAEGKTEKPAPKESPKK
ncbi:serine protease [bacterium]|nr:serine protease [bacterium]